MLEQKKNLPYYKCTHMKRTNEKRKKFNQRKGGLHLYNTDRTKKKNFFGFFSHFECNLVLFADIGYRLYVQPSITSLGKTERTMRKKNTNPLIHVMFRCLSSFWTVRSFIFHFIRFWPSFDYYFQMKNDTFFNVFACLTTFSW